MTSSPPLEFSALIEPMRLEEFRGRVQARSARHFPGHARRFEEVFSWQGLEQLLAMTHLWSDRTMNLVLDGRTVAAQEYCVAGQGRDGQAAMMADMAKVESFLAGGATCVLDRVETLLPGLQHLTQSLRSVFAASVVCNVYCSFQAHPGFPSHYDTTDVVALQIAGRKRWRIYQGRACHPAPQPGHQFADHPPQHHARARGALAMEVEMTPGDVLYLPRGQYHDALACSEASLHLSFGLTRATGLDFMSVLARSLPDEALLREEFPHFDDPQATSDHLARLGQRLLELLQDPGLARQAIAWQRERVFRDLPPRTGLPERRRATRVRVCQRPFDWLERDAGVLIRCAAGELALDPEAARVARQVLGRDVFLAGELVSRHGLQEAAARELLDALSAAGLIEPI